MNRKTALSLAFALAGAGTAYADDITIDPVPFTSTLSRAEVMADLAQFRRSGVDPWADGYNPVAHFQGGKSRAEVQAEYLANRAAVAAFNGEDSGSAYMAQARPQVQEIQLAVIVVDETQFAAAEGDEGQAR